MRDEHVERLCQSYPGAADAVLGCELFLGPFWDKARRDGVTPDEAVRHVKSAHARVVRLLGDESPHPAFARAASQFDHPDFRRYAAGKLGGY